MLVWLLNFFYFIAELTMTCLKNRCVLSIIRI
jgi:hypothetical protein